MEYKYFIAFQLVRADGTTVIENAEVSPTKPISGIEDIRNLEGSIQQGRNQLVKSEEQKIIKVTVTAMSSLS